MVVSWCLGFRMSFILSCCLYYRELRTRVCVCVSDSICRRWGEGTKRDWGNMKIKILSIRCFAKCEISKYNWKIKEKILKNKKINWIHLGLAITCPPLFVDSSVSMDIDVILCSLMTYDGSLTAYVNLCKVKT